MLPIDLSWFYLPRTSCIKAFAVVFTLCSTLPLPGLTATLTIGGTGADLGTMKLIGKAFERKYSGAKISVLASLGSSGGIRAVLAGKIDLAISSRLVKDKEQAKGANGIPYSRTPLVIATSARNPTTGLSSTELIAIYAGERLKWADGALVRLVLRPKSDSDIKILRSGITGLSAAIDSAYDRPGIPVGYTDQDSANLIQAAEWGVGTVPLSVILGENRSIKPMILNGVSPTPETIADGRYPLFKTLYLVVGGNPSALARRFIAFIRSSDGLKILTRTGHLVIAENVR
jgi:phosphate transport system substrate-binding protein